MIKTFSILSPTPSPLHGILSIMKQFTAFVLTLLSFAFAVDMPGASEQFYVAQGVFDKLEITRETCEQKDDVINFACGTFTGAVERFKETLADYVRMELPGLYPATDWFDNAGGIARDYRSAKGQYLFAYNPNGLVVVAFVPK
jgi:hypothetical protein